MSKALENGLANIKDNVNSPLIKQYGIALKEKLLSSNGLYEVCLFRRCQTILQNHVKDFSHSVNLTGLCTLASLCAKPTRSAASFVQQGTRLPMF